MKFLNKYSFGMVGCVLDICVCAGKVTQICLLFIICHLLKADLRILAFFLELL